LAKTHNLPPLPKADKVGDYPAVDYARASLARSIVRRRRAIGLTQVDLARRAGIRKESLCRIESGKVTPTLTSIEKITGALEKAEAKIAKES
jgi:predicted transcriptional regulator